MNIWSRENTFGSFLFAGEDPDGTCYVYYPSQPPLSGSTTESADEMSHEYCQNYCTGQSNTYNYYAVQGGNYCMCGIKIEGILQKAAQSKCDEPCTRTDSGEYCGAEGYFNLFEITKED